MDEFEEMKQETKEATSDATQLQEYGIIVRKDNMDKIQAKISTLFEKGFTVKIIATKQSDFMLE